MRRMYGTNSTSSQSLLPRNGASDSTVLCILASEVTHESFRDKVLTFYERPSWHDLIGETSFVQKALKLAQANWAGSTDFYATMQLITEIVREKKLGAGEIPDILVVSDMQFNEAIGSSSWKLAQNNIMMFRLFIANAKGTFFGMSESLEASSRR